MKLTGTIIIEIAGLVFLLAAIVLFLFGIYPV